MEDGTELVEGGNGLLSRIKKELLVGHVKQVQPTWPCLFFRLTWGGYREWQV